MVHFYGWGSTASKLETQHEEAVYYLQLRPQKFLVLTVSGVSDLNNLTVVLLQVIPPTLSNEIF